MINEADRKRQRGFAASDNDMKLVEKAAKIMQRSKSQAIMVLVKRFIEKRKAGLL
jgi:hypothetical protein